MDVVEVYAASAGLTVCPKTALVEGASDENLFRLAARLEKEHSGCDLFAGGFTVVAAGIGEAGGVNGVSLQLHRLRGMAGVCLLPNGKPKYRFIGVLDNDRAGQMALNAARFLDQSLLEFRDLYLLWPRMPWSGTRDPRTLGAQFKKENAPFAGLDWEIEDFVGPGIWEAFESEYPDAVRRPTSKNGETHRDLSREGKSQFHKYVLEWASHGDLLRVIDALKALRYFLGAS